MFAFSRMHFRVQCEIINIATLQPPPRLSLYPLYCRLNTLYEHWLWILTKYKQNVFTNLLKSPQKEQKLIFLYLRKSIGGEWRAVCDYDESLEGDGGMVCRHIMLTILNLNKYLCISINAEKNVIHWRCRWWVLWEGTIRLRADSRKKLANSVSREMWRK